MNKRSVTRKLICLSFFSCQILLSAVLIACSSDNDSSTLYGDELLIIDEEIFDYTYKIIKLQDETLLFFGDFLNQIKIETNGNIKVLFTGSHVEILKEIILDENNLIFIDKITQKLKILTNKDINWHKEIFPDYPPNKEFKKIKNNEDNDLNKSMTID